jgi:hypothetical protein
MQSSSALCAFRNPTQRRKTRQGKKQISIVSDGGFKWGGHPSAIRHTGVKIHGVKSIDRKIDIRFFNAVDFCAVAGGGE